MHDKINSCSAHRTLPIIRCETFLSAILPSNFTCAFFTLAFHTCDVYMPILLPAQSIWCTLHALSFTCAIHTLQNNHYPQFHYTRIKSPLQHIHVPTPGLSCSQIATKNSRICEGINQGWALFCVAGPYDSWTYSGSRISNLHDFKPWFQHAFK